MVLYVDMDLFVDLYVVNILLCSSYRRNHKEEFIWVARYSLCHQFHQTERATGIGTPLQQYTHKKKRNKDIMDNKTQKKRKKKKMKITKSFHHKKHRMSYKLNDNRGNVP